MTTPEEIESLMASIESLDHAKLVLKRAFLVTEYLTMQLCQDRGVNEFTILGPAGDWAEKMIKEANERKAKNGG